MAGLDCIAMAISHLEREQELSDDSGSPQKMNTTSSPVSQEAPPSMPPRSTFDNTPRLVSSDSMGYEDRSVLHSRPNNAPAPVAGQGTCIPAVVEGMSPDAITRLVDGLSQDKEIHGPPPAPPTPTEVITEVKDCDVLCGRGGETNHHSGNVQYRNLVKKYRPLYIISKRRDKPRIAEKIVRDVRRSGGRFLRKDKQNAWRDVGNTKAREKTSQALREGAPDLRSPGKGKEEQQQQQAPSSPTQSLGTRSFEEYNSVTSNMYNGVSPVSSYSSSRPSVIDNQQRDEASQFTNTAYYPSPKKMRLDNLGMPAHSFSQFSGVPAVQGLQSYIASELASAGGTRRVSQQTSSPSTVASEESRAEEKKDDAPKPKPRGPRLKLLKKRLEAEESDGSC